MMYGGIMGLQKRRGWHKAARACLAPMNASTAAEKDETSKCRESMADVMLLYERATSGRIRLASITQTCEHEEAGTTSSDRRWERVWMFNVHQHAGRVFVAQARHLPLFPRRR